MNINFNIEWAKKRKSIVVGSMDMLETAIKKSLLENTKPYEAIPTVNGSCVFHFKLRRNNTNGTAGLYDAYLNNEHCGTLFVPYNLYKEKEFYITFKPYEEKEDLYDLKIKEYKEKR